MSIHIVPLAITMMAGPQIMSAIIFVTHPDPPRVSIPFIIGVAIATTIGIAIATVIGSALGTGSGSGSGHSDKTIEFVLIGLLIALAIRSYRGRETSEPPKWLGALLAADARKAFETGLLLIFLMPSDLLIMITVGFDLDRTGSAFTDAVPFIAATVLIAALPFLAYLLVRRRAAVAMPKVRDWMNTNSWLVNIIVYCVFIALILG